jgi:hypothetical protein
MAISTFGGRIEVKIGTTIYKARGDITIMPTSFETTAEANQDGSVYATRKNMPREAEMTFQLEAGERWNVTEQSSLNVTIQEESSGRTHQFTDAVVTGRPSVNLSNGEVSGLKIASALYSVFGDN